MSPPAATRRRLRVGLFAFGTVMWIAVFAVIYWKWRSARENTADPSDNPAKVPVTVPVFQPYALPDFQLTDQNGKTVRRTDLAGQPWIASFLFARCTTHCPRVAAELEKLQKSLGDLPVRMVTISVDPENDTPDVLKRWADSLHADAEKWKFLTGRPAAVYRLLREGFQISAVQNTGEDRTPGNEVSHSQSVLLVNSSGTVIGKYDGSSEVDLNRLRRDLRELDSASTAAKKETGTKTTTGSP